MTKSRVWGSKGRIHTDLLEEATLDSGENESKDASLLTDLAALFELATLFDHCISLLDPGKHFIHPLAFGCHRFQTAYLPALVVAQFQHLTQLHLEACRIVLRFVDHEEIGELV